MTEAYRKRNSYRTLMHLAHQKPEPAKDTWGVNAFSGLCNKENGHSYIPGSIEKLLERSKAGLIKALDKLQKRRGIPKEGKDRIASLKARVELANSSDYLESIIDEAIEVATPSK
jgi:hypothetical protein